ncbi:MAG: tRNA (5-methylaminomethyl-2-thiouridine)(34)-methyltransferase MnmD [Robiginitomaculum sp.]
MVKPSKPAPRPLIASPPARLDFSRDSGPVSLDFDDIYYSVDDGLEEARDVFLKACGLPARWQGRERFTIGELGFGSGLNFLAVWELWREYRPSPTARLHFVSVEGFPLSKDELTRALAPWDALSELSALLIEKWPGRVLGQHRLELDDGVVLTLCHDAVDGALANLTMRADSWFLDGFSPAKNADMWSEAVFSRIYDLSAAGAMVGTFTVAGFVRRGLAAAGFDVSKQPGFGRKRERLEAVKAGETAPPMPKPNPVVIGSGIAGASLARSFALRGVIPVIIDAEDGTAASGNLAAIVKPRLDLQDRPESRFYLAAYLYAQAAYEGHTLSRGVAHLAKSESEAGRFVKMAKQGALPLSHMRWLGAAQMQDRSGLENEFGGLWFDRAPVINPAGITGAWTCAARRITGRVTALKFENDMWNVYGADNALLASGSDIYVCAGADIERLLPGISVRYTRGQVTRARISSGDNPLKCAVNYGGYAISLGPKNLGNFLLGATHGWLDWEKAYALREADEASNMDGFKRVSGCDVEAFGGRASVRVTTVDTLPIFGPVGRNGLHVMTGLSGRGFVYAPLLAEQMVSDIMGETAAMTHAACARFLPK